MKVAELLSDWTHYMVLLERCLSPFTHITLEVARLLHLTGTVCLHTFPGRSW